MPNLRIFARFPAFALACASLLLTTPVRASAITFANTQPLTTFGGVSTTVFTLDSNQSPSTEGSYYFIFNNVPVVLNGTTYLQQVGFEFAEDSSGNTAYVLNVGTNIGFEDGLIQKGDGIFFEPFITPSVLFTGSTSQPVFQLGTFTDFTYPETLTVTAVTPEPSAAALFASGLFATWCLTKRR